jgi:hypothetical protein
MNNFGLLFEYSNNIRIFILLNKLPILAQNFKKNPKKSKLCDYHVLGLICTQIVSKGQQITKLVLSMLLVFFLKNLSESLQFNMVY